MKKHAVIKKTLDKDMCSFLNTYLLEKREILKILTKEKYISPFSEIHGKLNGDPQIPDTFCISDLVFFIFSSCSSSLFCRSSNFSTWSASD